MGGLSAALAEAERMADVYEQAGAPVPCRLLLTTGLLCCTTPVRLVVQRSYCQRRPCKLPGR